MRLLLQNVKGLTFLGHTDVRYMHIARTTGPIDMPFGIWSRVGPVADPGRAKGVQTPALLFRCPFLKRTYFENMSLRFLAEQGAS